MTLLVVLVAILVPSLVLSSPTATASGAAPHSQLKHNLKDLINKVDDQIYNKSNGASNITLLETTVRLLATVQDLPTDSGDIKSDLKLKTIKSIHNKSTLVETCKMLKIKDVHECSEKISELDVLVKLRTALNFYDSAVRHLGQF
uniref:Uncharacterized protein n=1 Tax=Amphimedon queenslandica TaxID=400682 RepID=A0A1X7VRT7_AMPQE